MPTTDQGFRYPASTDDPDVAGDMSNLAADLNAFLKLPDAVSATGSGVIASAAGTFAALSTPCSLAFQNPSSTYDLWVMLIMNGYLTNSGTTGAVSAHSVASGGVNWAATGYGAGGPLSVADTMSAGAGVGISCGVSFPVKLPAGSASTTFSVQGSRSNTDGSKVVQAASLRIMPIRFIKP